VRTILFDLAGLDIVGKLCGQIHNAAADARYSAVAGRIILRTLRNNQQAVARPRRRRHRQGYSRNQ
jgi:hypothetical protein